MISGKNVFYKYGNGKNDKVILDNVSFELPQGRITTFMGQSGAGKTTLLKCLCNLNMDYEGSILCDDKDLKLLSPKERASAVGFVLQQFYLFPHMTALENCTFALVHTMQEPATKAKASAKELLSQLGMENYLDRYPKELSGGQQQRVAIARALALRPQVLLLDEPTSALDPESKKSLEGLLLELNRTGITIALSSHDMAFIRKIMDVIYFMENGTIAEHCDVNAAAAPTPKINEFLTHG